MDRTPSESTGEVIVTMSGWLVGFGVLLFALFPFALPGLILTAVFVLPLLVPLIPIALIAAVGLGLQRIWHAARGRSGRPRSTPAAPGRRRDAREVCEIEACC